MTTTDFLKHKYLALVGKKINMYVRIVGFLSLSKSNIVIFIKIYVISDKGIIMYFIDIYVLEFLLNINIHLVKL